MSQTDIPEVRCERCQTSFAPETKQCVHCGGPLGRGLLSGVRLQRPDSVGGDMALPYEHDEDSEELQVQGRGRNFVWILTAAMALGMSVVRACSGNG